MTSSLNNTTMTATKKLMALVAEAIDGTLYYYDDGFVISVQTGTHEVRFVYSLEGELEDTKVILPADRVLSDDEEVEG